MLRILFKMGGWLVRCWRPLVGVLLLAAGGYLVSTSLDGGRPVDDLKRWLSRTGDADLKAHYARITDQKEKRAFGAACKVYERTYGKGAWIAHFKKENPDLQHATYADLAEIALGLESVKDRDAFLEAHAAAYEVCVKSGLAVEVHRYVDLLKELRKKGGRDWHVAARNPFAVAVYSVVQEKPDLWKWYLDNQDWCDAFLLTCGPTDEMKLDEVVDFMSHHADLLRQFHKEIRSLNEEELRELANGDDTAEAQEALFASCLTFVGYYHDMLDVMRKAGKDIRLLEAMPVLANNADAFDSDDPASRRQAARELAYLHDQKRALWDFAAEDAGLGVLQFQRDMPQYAEQLVGRFGALDVIPLLNKYFRDSPVLFRTAAEILSRCEEPGWVVLGKFKDNRQFKAMMENPKIGFRVVPYYLLRGDAVFSKLADDDRYVDELLDKDGKLKRQDVSWYELSPIGGDLATVIKKWAQNRPIETSELFWATFDIVDTALMTLSFGSSKAATTVVKTGGKVVAKTARKRVGRAVAQKALRRIGQKSVTRTTAPIGLKKSRKGLSFLKRSTNWFKVKIKTVPTQVKTKADDLVKGLRKGTDKWRNLSPEVKDNIYRAAKAAAFIKWGGHTLPEKGPDFVHNVIEDLGETLGKTAHAVTSGVADGVKAAVRESVGLSEGADDSLPTHILWMLLGGGLILVGVWSLFPSRAAR